MSAETLIFSLIATVGINKNFYFPSLLNNRLMEQVCPFHFNSNGNKRNWNSNEMLTNKKNIVLWCHHALLVLHMVLHMHVANERKSISHTQFQHTSITDEIKRTKKEQ